MALADGKAAFKTNMKVFLEALRDEDDKNYDTAVDDFLTKLSDEMETWIKTANISVPGTGLLAPSGDVTGTASGTLT